MNGKGVPLWTGINILKAPLVMANKFTLRACLHGGGGPQVGEVTRLCGVTRLSVKSLILIWSRLHDIQWGDPPTRWIAWSARPGNPLSRGQIFPCKRSKWVTRLAGDRFVIHQIRAKFSLRWLCIITKGNNRKPQHWRELLKVTARAASECIRALTAKTLGLPA